MLYIFFGPSTSGKTTLLDLAKEQYGSKCIVKKVSTRGARGDNDDIFSCPMGFANDDYYHYKMYGHDYGFLKSDIKQACLSEEPYFAICSDIKTVREMKRKYDGRLIVTFFLLDVSKEELRKVQERRGLSESEIEQRINHVALINELLLINMDLFNDVMISHHAQNGIARYKKYLNCIIMEQCRKY